MLEKCYNDENNKDNFLELFTYPFILLFYRDLSLNPLVNLSDSVFEGFSDLNYMWVFYVIIKINMKIKIYMYLFLT